MSVREAQPLAPNTAAAIRLGPGIEFDRIRGIASALGAAAKGLGDDCALIPWGDGHLAVSVDLSVDGVHFRRDWQTFGEIGWKATAAALSDLAAMGAEVIGVLTSVAIPGEGSQAQLLELMSGVGAASTSTRAPAFAAGAARSAACGPRTTRMCSTAARRSVSAARWMV